MQYLQQRNSETKIFYFFINLFLISLNILQYLQSKIFAIFNGNNTLLSSNLTPNTKTVINNNSDKFLPSYYIKASL